MNIWQGKRIRLRGVEPTDAETFAAWNRDSEMARMVDFVWWPLSQVAIKQQTEKTALQMGKDDVFDFAMESEAGELVGTINSHTCERRVGTFSYGLAVRAAHRRKGYAFEAILLLLRYFFDELRYQKATVYVHSNNLPSIRLHERLKFELEGQVRRVVFTQGRYFDGLIYGMTVEEFRERFPDATSVAWVATCLETLRGD